MATVSASGRRWDGKKEEKKRKNIKTKGTNREIQNGGRRRNVLSRASARAREGGRRQTIENVSKRERFPDWLIWGPGEEKEGSPIGLFRYRVKKGIL